MRCEFVGCQDQHLGKFSSCWDEAVYLLALDERWDGDVDFGVCWCVIDVDEPVDIDILGSPLTIVPVPAGVYLVETNSQGFVYVTRWAPESNVVSFADALLNLEGAYGAWLDSDD